MGQYENPRKPKVKFLYISIQFLEKIDFSREKTDFSEKNSFLSAKNSDDLFLVINSQIFAPPFSNFHPFPAKIYLPNSLKFVTFSKKPLNTCIFSGNVKKPRKNQEKPKVFKKP